MNSKPAMNPTLAMNPTPAKPLLGSDEEERTSGKISYLDVLERLHRELRPELYLEIGVRYGGSIIRSQGPAIGVDPEPALRVPLPAQAKLFETTSDAFFANLPEGCEPDFGFIDGMHLFEFALRDFINLERCAKPGAIVAIDDVLPSHSAQALRERRTRVWTGDVWRLIPTLRRHRPGLQLVLLDTSPTGLLLISGLDGADSTLSRCYHEIVGADARADVPEATLSRDGALDPEGAEFAAILDVWKAGRAA
jgi:hypothetical protein